jgi:hypothetical protein
MSAAAREVAPGGRLGRADATSAPASHNFPKSAWERLSAFRSWKSRCPQLLGKLLQGGVLDEPMRSWNCRSAVTSPRLPAAGLHALTD